MNAFPVLWAMTLGATPSDDEPPVSFARDVMPILRTHCQGCHQPARAKGRVVLTDFDSLFKGEHSVVVPGDVEASDLVDVIIAHGDSAPEMPPDGPPLSATDVAQLRRWIEAGATNDQVATAPQPTPEQPPVYAAPPVIPSVDISPDGTLVAVAGYHEVLLYALDGTLQRRLIGASPRLEAVRFSPDGSRIAAVGGRPGALGEVQVWDPADGTLVLSHAETYDVLFGASWSPDGTLLAFGATDRAVRALNVDEGKRVLFNRAHEDWVLDTAFSTDGSHLVSVSRDRSMKLVQVPRQQFIDNITSITPGALAGGLQSVARHPTKDELLIGGADGVAKRFRMYREKKRVIGDDYNLLRSFDRIPGRIFSVAYSPDGTKVVAASSAGDSGTVALFGTEADAALWTQSIATATYTVRFHPHDGSLLCAGFDGHVRRLAGDDGRELAAWSVLPSTETPR